MAEIGVNYAFAVIGNTNPLPIKCSKFGLYFFFPARKIFLSSKLFSAMNVEHQRSLLAQCSK